MLAPATAASSAFDTDPTEEPEQHQHHARRREPSSDLSPGFPATANDWYFPAAVLDATPSMREDGWTREMELEHRVRGIGFIRLVGISLRLPQLAIATGCTFFQRFYLVRPFSRHHPYDVAGACLFLAAKVEECAARIEEFSKECAEKASKRDTVTQREQAKWHATILSNEAIVLEAIRFDLVIEHPYFSLLLLSDDQHMRLPRDVVRTAWVYVNDSYRTTACVVFRPRVLACAAICFACKLYGFQEGIVPDFAGSGEEGEVAMLWDRFQVNREDVLTAMATIAEDMARRGQQQVVGGGPSA